MKSPMIAALGLLPEAPVEPTAATSDYTDLQVLQSAAGHYLGTLYQERNAAGDLLWEEPGSRDSGYYRTRDEAERALKVMTALGNDVAAMTMRQHP